MAIDAKDVAQKLHDGQGPQPGQIFRHYKGGLYSVIARAIKEDTLEPLVIYRSNLKGSCWARTLQDWEQYVDHPSKPYSVPRFTREAD